MLLPHETTSVRAQMVTAKADSCAYLRKLNQNSLPSLTILGVNVYTATSFNKCISPP